MEFKNTENKPYKTTCGKTIWHSRNLAVSTCIIRTNPENSEKLQVLGIKRGNKMTHPGKYCFPCGYLDWDETVPEAASREIYEESGLEIPWQDLEFIQLDSDPKKFGQNVSVHFVHYYTANEEINLKNVDSGEVESAKWFDIDEAEKLDWAFDHLERIKSLVKNVE